jgi:hypothetical protein
MLVMPAAAQQPPATVTATAMVTVAATGEPMATPTRTAAELIGMDDETGTFGEIITRYGVWGLIGLLGLAGAYWFVSSLAKKAGESIVEYIMHLWKATIDTWRNKQAHKQALDTGTLAYLAWLRDEYSELPNIPVKRGQINEQLLLEDVYVPLRVVERTQMEKFWCLTIGDFAEGQEGNLRREAFQYLEENQRVFRLLSDQEKLPNLAADEARKRPSHRRSHVQDNDTPPIKEMTTTCLLLVGDAGSGKTTTLHYGALVLAQDYQQQQSDGAQTLDLHCVRPLLPFYIRLTLVATYIREVYARTKPEDTAHLHGAPSTLLLEWLDGSIVAQVQPSIPEHMPSTWIKTGGCLVMLDGLDETGDKQMRDYMQRLIRNLQQDYGNNRYLVASRPFEDLSLGGFLERHLSPMHEGEMQLLLQNWFGAVQKSQKSGTATVQQTTVIADQVAHLQSEFQHNARLFEMATNPLLLTSMAQLVYSGTGLPRQRAKIYFELVSLLLYRWRDREKAGGLPSQRSEHSKLYDEDETSVQRRLQKLAAWMQENKQREGERGT